MIRFGKGPKYAALDSEVDDRNAPASPPTVETAEAALESYKREPADLVITDVRLPRMNGVELARRLGARRRPAPVIVVTAYGDEKVLEEIDSLGVHAFFLKPFQMDRLRKSVQAALRARAA